MKNQPYQQGLPPKLLFSYWQDVFGTSINIDENHTRESRRDVSDLNAFHHYQWEYQKAVFFLHHFSL